MRTVIPKIHNKELNQKCSERSLMNSTNRIGLKVAPGEAGWVADNFLLEDQRL